MAHLAEKTFEWAPGATMRIDDRLGGYVSATPRRRKVAIVGAGLGKEQAPYDDPEWEVWALNVCGAFDAQGRMRADRWFELHEMHAQSDLDLLWMMKCPVPLYLVPMAFDLVGEEAVEREDDFVSLWDKDRRPTGVIHIPQAVRYPLERIEKKHGSYFTCTFAYEMALALEEGFTDVGLYGVEVAFGTKRERTFEFACVSWWLGYLEGKGINLHLPRGSTLGQHKYRYGIDYTAEKEWVERYVRACDKWDAQRDDETGMGG